MSEGHPEAGTDGERDIDFGDMTDDEEVELNLLREEAVERDPLGGDLPGVTSSGASATEQEELYRLEPPNGARPKWTRSGTATSGDRGAPRSGDGSIRGYGWS